MDHPIAICLILHWEGSIYIGIADWAASNWQFLKKHTSQQILDVYHASGYLGAVATALYPQDVNQQKQYLSQSCHQLKHEAGAATQLYKQMAQLSQSDTHTKAIQEKLGVADLRYDGLRNWDILELKVVD